MEMIAAEIKDLRMWQEALKFWAGNNYRPQSVFKIIEYYKDLVTQGHTRMPFGHVKTDVGRNADPAPQANCEQCADVGFWYEQIDDNPMHAIRHDCDCVRVAA